MTSRNPCRLPSNLKWKWRRSLSSRWNRYGEVLSTIVFFLTISEVDSISSNWIYIRLVYQFRNAPEVVDSGGTTSAWTLPGNQEKNRSSIRTNHCGEEACWKHIKWAVFDWGKAVHSANASLYSQRVFRKIPSSREISMTMRCVWKCWNKKTAVWSIG